jgi:hypothetical protein
MAFLAPFVPAIAGVASAVIGSDASRRASNRQQDSVNAANALQQQNYEQTRADQAPWRAAGQQSLERLMGLLSDGRYSTAQFTPQDLQNDPGYKFQQEQGMRGINNMADAFGVGGSSLKAASRFNQGLADTSYNNAFNRFQTERTNTLNPLFQAAGLGQVANQQIQSAGQNYANQYGGNVIGGGNAAAANSINQGNIYANLVNQAGARWSNPNPLSAMSGSGGWGSGDYFGNQDIGQYL